MPTLSQGVYSGSGTIVALLQELSAGPGFVVAGPLFNGIGNLGGLIGPIMVGALVQVGMVKSVRKLGKLCYAQIYFRVPDDSVPLTPLQSTHSFAIPCTLMAVCLFLAGLMVASMPRLITLPPTVHVGLFDPRPQATHSASWGWVELRVRE